MDAMRQAKRVVIYVDDETMKLDLTDVHPEEGVVVEIRRWVKEDNKRFSDPVVYEITQSGLMAVDTRIVER